MYQEVALAALRAAKGNHKRCVCRSSVEPRPPAGTALTRPVAARRSNAVTPCARNGEPVTACRCVTSAVGARNVHLHALNVIAFPMSPLAFSEV